MKHLRTALLLAALLLTISSALAEAAPPTGASPVWQGTQPVADYTREPPIAMPAGDGYLQVDWGVTTYRCDNFRRNAASGTLPAAPTALETLWAVETGSHDVPFEDYQGFDWVSQPLILKWPKEIRANLNISEAHRDTAALKEVIFASLDGKIYFLNLADGAATREPILLGYPILGAATVHPLGYPLLLTGQYTDELSRGSGSIGLHHYELLTQRHVQFLDGRLSLWGMQGLHGAFNTAALIDPNTNTAVALSKDGYLFTQQLDVRIYVSESSDYIAFTCDHGLPVFSRITPEQTLVTASPVMYGSRVWFGTGSRQGGVTCADTSLMKPLWHSPLNGQYVYALAMDQNADGTLALYAGEARSFSANRAPVSIYRLNAEDGSILWQREIGPAVGMGTSGAVASPVIGENSLDGMVFFTVTDVTLDDVHTAAAVLALDKATGELRWSQSLPGLCRSAPVAVYTEDGRGWLVQADQSGRIHLLDGLTGEIITTHKLDVTGHISSPAVYGDMMVIGAGTPDGGRIYGIRLLTGEACIVPDGFSASNQLN